MGLVVGYILYLGWVSIALQKAFEAIYLILLLVVATIFAR